MIGSDLTKGIHNFYTAHQTIYSIGSLLCIQIAIMQTKPRIFGLCNNAHYHGHNYELEVKVKGEVDEVTGYLIDMKVLKDYIDEEVVERFDHKNLNLDTEEFKDVNPTAENIVWVIWERLRARLDQKFSLSVRLYETPRNFVEYNG